MNCAFVFRFSLISAKNVGELETRLTELQLDQKKFFFIQINLY